MNNEKQLKSLDLRSFLKDFEGNVSFTIVNFLTLITDTDETSALIILARFSETLSEIKQTLHQALNNDDFGAAWEYCHKVSSYAELLGFISFSNKAKQLGLDIKNVSLENEKKSMSMQQLIDESQNLRNKIEASCQRIKHYR